jgi:hypothetical protein
MSPTSIYTTDEVKNVSKDHEDEGIATVSESISER